MNKRMLCRLCAVLVTAALLLAALAGCGAKNGAAQGQNGPAAPVSGPAADPTPAPAADPTPASPSSAENGGEDAQPPAEDGAVHVRSVAELVEAIGPGADIVIEPGRYDLTEYLSEHPNRRDVDQWNEEHAYVDILDVFDGWELVIRDVDGLSVAGGADDPAATEIVTQPRYASVLNFSNCTDVTLACLTLGHTDGGDCSGNVLDLYNCQDFRLRSMDLYGCGAIGLSAMGGCADVQVSNSVLRDCAYGPFEIYNGAGEFLFTACTLAGSGGGGYYEPEAASSLKFVGCAFGQEESNRWLFDEDAVFEDCEWSEITAYPDVEPDDREVPAFDADHMTELPFNEEVLRYTNWVGYAAVDPASGETQYLMGSGREDAEEESAYLELYGDGEGWLEFRSRATGLTWECLDETQICLTCEGRNLYASLYRNAAFDPWMLLQYDNELIWLWMY